jgi:TonB family protein
MFGWNETAWFSIFIGVALKSTAVLGVAWLSAFLLRGRSAAARHLVWTAAAAAVLALPFLSVSLPALAVPAASALVPNVGVLFQTTATAHPDGAASQSPQRAGSTAPFRSLPWTPDWRLSLMLLWAAGSAVAFTQMLIACARMWRLRRAAKPSPDRSLSVDLAQELGIAHAVEVLETAEGTMPMTFGIVHPAVFMPSDAAEWTAARRRIVLLHELAHVSRGDVATQLLARLAVILNWWNPLAWTAWREFLKERERATDDLVLHAGACASDYASHLLEVARTMQSAPNLGWAAVAMARRSQLEGRLLAILDSRVNRKAAGRASALIAVLAAVAIVAPLAAVRAQEKAIPPDVDATIRAATAQKNPEMLEKPAAALEASHEYEAAQKLMESAVAIREEKSGKLSVEYGVGLMKIADLEKKRGHWKEAEAFYTKALSVLGDRAEAAPALMYLSIRKKNPAEAIELLEKARNLDPSLAGPATMWMALIREHQQNAEEAEALYKSALALENPDSADAVNTMELYGRLLINQGRGDEGKAMRDRASAVMQALSLKDRAQHAKVETGLTVFRIGGGVTPPSVLYKMDPEYTEDARIAKYSGTVVVYVEISPGGVPQNMRIVKGIGLGLDEKALEAITKWRFKPGTKDGIPVTVMAQIEVNFKLL